MEALEKPIVLRMRERFGEALSAVTDFRGDLSVTVPVPKIPEFLTYLKKEEGYLYFLDLTAVDYLKWPDERDKRFDVVYHLYGLDHKKRIRVKAPVAEGEPVPSITSLWKGANWFEREAWDMFGIHFEGHPNLKRILCHHDFVGHPLRKDYEATKNQSLKESDVGELLEEIQASGGKERARTQRYYHGKYILNIGPSHPAMHGAFRLLVELDGEIIRQAAAEIGYLHRCFEKMCEVHPYHQVLPYTERLIYTSGPMNNVTYCMAVEKLMQITIPPRAQMMRVILSEFSRIIDHLVAIGANAVDVGALSNFWYAFGPRESVYDLFVSWGGGRMFPRGIIIGGMMNDFPSGWIEAAREKIKLIEKALADIDGLLTKNKIWIKRTRGVGVIRREDAIDYGVSGPVLRACGVDYDVRKDHPYYGYDQFEFEIPITDRGDTYDRYLIRMEEIRQSLRILKQALDNLPEGAIAIDDPAIVFPDKEDVYGNIEGLMNQFMLVIDGLKPPKGDVYAYTESANGEQGFYLVSDGTGFPYRLKVRPPTFANYQPFPQMIEGSLLADAVAIIGSLNIIAGELDR